MCREVSRPHLSLFAPRKYCHGIVSRLESGRWEKECVWWRGGAEHVSGLCQLACWHPAIARRPCLAGVGGGGRGGRRGVLPPSVSSRRCGGCGPGDACRRRSAAAAGSAGSLHAPGTSIVCKIGSGTRGVGRVLRGLSLSNTNEPAVYPAQLWHAVPKLGKRHAAGQDTAQQRRVVAARCFSTEAKCLERSKRLLNSMHHQVPEDPRSAAGTGQALGGFELATAHASDLITNFASLLCSIDNANNIHCVIHRHLWVVIGGG